MKSKGSRQPAAPVAAPVAPVARPALPAPAPEPELPAPHDAPTEPPPAPEEDPEGPDIDSFRTKKAALACAEDYGVDLDPEAKLSEMKAQLEAAIYGDD